MLRPANVVDLPIFRALIREGAVSGDFNPDLATESRETTVFFNNLRQALGTGYFVEPDPRTGDLVTAAVLAYVYVQDDDPSLHRPIGFGVFKAAAIGYELWLTGIDAQWRGKGHGRKMLAALFETAPGRTAYVARVKPYGHESLAMARLLQSFDYTCIRETPKLTLYLRRDAPDELRALHDGTPGASRRAS